MYHIETNWNYKQMVVSDLRLISKVGSIQVSLLTYDKIYSF